MEGKVEQDERRGFSFVVERMSDLGRALAAGFRKDSLIADRPILARRPGRAVESRPARAKPEAPPDGRERYPDVEAAPPIAFPSLP